MTIKLIQGDCLEEMQKLIDEGVKVDLILTDLPYGTTSCKWDNIIPFEPMWDCINSLSNETTPSVLFGSEPFSTQLRSSNLKNYRYDWIWQKSNPASVGIAKYQPMRYHELISVFYKKFGQYYPQMIPRTSPRIKQAIERDYVFNSNTPNSVMNGCRNDTKNKATKYDPNWKYPSTILPFNTLKGGSKEKVAHPTQKPVKLLEYLIKTYTNEQDIVLDFTMGSGSTGVACVNTNRNFIGIELDENYYKIAQERINETKKQTKLM